MDAKEDRPRNLGEQLDELLYRWDEARRRPAVVVAAIGVGVALLTLSWFLTRSGDRSVPPVDDRIPQVALVPAAPPTTAVAVMLVHVTGAVRAEGVYELETGARVMDAIAAAGGPTSDGQTHRLNLAAPVADGMQIRVPVEGESVTVIDTGSGDATPGPINLNTASGQQLESLPGIGPATAAAIIAYRDEHGGFVEVTDLLGVRGIGEAKLASLEDLVVAR
ncbi:MAG: ComEA family DNA-binding protein [Acidimicrobiales bacterium]|nr:ComEA family DNA-binding protein [Acidimicrobiales bacterium]